MGGICAYKAYPTLAKYRPLENKSDELGLLPVTVTFNKAINEFKYGDLACITLSVKSTCYVYLYGEVGKDKFIRIFPYTPKGSGNNPEESTIDPGSLRKIDWIGNGQLLVNCDPMKFHLFALNPKTKGLKIGESYEQTGAGQATIMEKSTTEEVMKARAMAKKDPGNVIEYVFDCPVASKESYEEYRKKQDAAGKKQKSAGASKDQGGAANQDRAAAPGDPSAEKPRVASP
jgi:hypothetical protein